MRVDEEMGTAGEPGGAGPGPSRPLRDGDGPEDGGRRLFMAGRVEGDVQRVRFASSIRAPIRGPWSLALVVRSG